VSPERPGRFGILENYVSGLRRLPWLKGLAGWLVPPNSLRGHLAYRALTHFRPPPPDIPPPPPREVDAAACDALARSMRGEPATTVSGDRTPFVSIVVLNFNGERIIGRCLDHLLALTYANYEIIVVDNGSTDGSLRVLEGYLGRGRLSVISSLSNRGCPGGRNLGVLYATGEIVAFVDNDGYVHPRWLEEAVGPFSGDPGVGAVASVVFFSRNKFLLNGAGGTLNLQGYGLDYCFFEPHEFARLPHEVLYPMGCGMLVRREVLDRIGPWDDAVLNYYDDTELGFRVWKSGYRVVVAPQAWVDHEFNYTSQFVPSRGLLVEKGRIRTVLKYFPAKGFLVWLAREARHFWKNLPRVPIYLAAWLWNLLHLRSALRWRRRFRGGDSTCQRLLLQQWGWVPSPAPTNSIFQSDFRSLAPSLSLDVEQGGQLNYGWHYLEQDGPLCFRWSAAHASAFFRTERPTAALDLTLRICAPQRVRLIVRPLGPAAPVLDVTLADLDVLNAWLARQVPCPLPPGGYELLVLPEKPALVHGRTLGVALAHAEFT
jgi:GT2 family glycosyltransferase